jgi:hypothetical protein
LVRINKISWERIILTNSHIYIYIYIYIYSSPNILRVIKSIRMRLAGHVARMGRREACIGFCWGNQRKRDHWGDPGVDGRIILGWIFRKWDVGVWAGLGWLRKETGGGQF